MARRPDLIPFTTSGSSILPPYQQMLPGQSLVSPSKQYTLALQEDANLVIYDNHAGVAVWVADSNQPYSKTGSLGPYAFNEVYLDGNIIYNDQIHHRQWTVVITADSGTGFGYRTHLSLQDDGNLVLLDIYALWSSDTSKNFTPGTAGATLIEPGKSLEMGREYHAGEYSLVFQGDGNLVVYNNARIAVWNSQTQNKGAKLAVMQTDGNFVIYDGSNKPLWSSNTAGFPGAYAQIQTNGAFVVCYQRPLWARFGFVPVPPRPPRKVFYIDHSKDTTDPYPTYGHIGWEF